MVTDLSFCFPSTHIGIFVPCTARRNLSWDLVSSFYSWYKPTSEYSKLIMTNGRQNMTTVNSDRLSIILTLWYSILGFMPKDVDTNNLHIKCHSLLPGDTISHLTWPKNGPSEHGLMKVCSKFKWIDSTIHLELLFTKCRPFHQWLYILIYCRKQHPYTTGHANVEYIQDHITNTRTRHIACRVYYDWYHGIVYIDIKI